jgi:hypothetical protein
MFGDGGMDSVMSDGKAVFMRGRFYHLSPGRAVDLMLTDKTPLQEYIEQHGDEIAASIWAGRPGRGA